MSEVIESTASAELAGDDAAMALLAAKRQPTEQVAEEEQEEAPEEQPAEDAEEEEESTEEAVEDDDPEIDLGDIKAKKSEILAWKQGEMKDADYRRKTAEAAEAKREAQAIAERAQAERSHYANHLDVVLGRLQTQLIGDQAELARLAQEDPAAWVSRNAEFQQRYADYQSAVVERQALSQRQQAEQDAQLSEYVREQQQVLQEKLPEWRDPQIKAKEAQGIADFLLQRGYSTEELSSLQDARALLIVRDAWKAMQQMKARESASGKQVTKEPAKSLKPGAATQNQQNSNAYRDALKAARKTGREEDVMAVLAAKRNR